MENLTLWSKVQFCALFLFFYAPYILKSQTVVSWNFSNSLTASGGLEVNNDKVLTSTAGGTLGTTAGNSSVGSCTSPYANVNNWQNGQAVKFYQINFVSTGYAGLNLTFDSRASSTGPRDFEVTYSVDALSYHSLGSYAHSSTLSGSSGPTICTNKSFDLPVICDNQPNVIIRFVQASNIAVDGSTVVGGGTSGIDNIIVSYSSLPVSLVFFNAISKEKVVDLLWSTATEKNNDYMAIERSVDGQNFSEIGRVQGAGNSVERIDYSFSDRFPYSGTNYYRLRQVDFDGSSTYHKVIAVDFNGESENTLAINQSLEEVSVQFRAPNAAGQLVLVDAMGRIIRTQKFEEKVQSARISIHDLPKGFYVVQIRQTDGLIKAMPLIK